MRWLMAIFVFQAGALFAQPPNAAPANTAVVAGGLKILVLEGQDGVNNIRIPMPANLVVEVRDENDRTVEGAMVTFQMPLMGPSGGFEGGVRNKDAITNFAGQAAVSYTPNMEPGRFTVQVKTTQGGRGGMTTIMQQNATTSEAAHRKSWFSRHKVLIIVIAAAAVGTGLAVGLTRGGKSSSGSSSGLTITPGVPTISGP
jgi:hypothetical protein